MHSHLTPALSTALDTQQGICKSCSEIIQLLGDSGVRKNKLAPLFFLILEGLLSAIIYQDVPNSVTTILRGYSPRILPTSCQMLRHVAGDQLETPTGEVTDPKSWCHEVGGLRFELKSVALQSLCS